MPRFNADPTGPINSQFHFSAVALDSLGASEYTLVGVVTDVSGSVSGFSSDEEAALASVVEACRKSPRADNLMLRFTVFNHALTEVHGFKLLQDCNPADYKDTLHPFGSTALYDACVDQLDALARYGKELLDNDFQANGILIVITDGCDNASKLTPGEVLKSVQRTMKAEILESLVTILIGVNVTSPAEAQALQDFAAQAQFTQFVNLGDATPQKLAKLASFVSKSISSQSQALGTGSASVSLTI